MLSEREAKTIIEKVLSYSRADEAEVNLGGGSTSHLRFARNTPSTSGTAKNVTLSVRSTFGKKSGTATTNQFDEKSLRDVV
jgi:predicted Zn-dependent protease